MRVNSLILQTLSLGAFMLNLRQETEVPNLGQCPPVAFLISTGKKRKEREMDSSKEWHETLCIMV